MSRRFGEAVLSIFSSAHNFTRKNLYIHVKLPKTSVESLPERIERLTPAVLLVFVKVFVNFMLNIFAGKRNPSAQRNRWHQKVYCLLSLEQYAQCYYSTAGFSLIPSNKLHRSRRLHDFTKPSLQCDGLFAGRRDIKA